jgi:predicted enzyme related to lactoylglutathione lyase
MTDATRPEPTTGAVGWLRAVVIDAADPERLATFWQAVLGVGRVEVMEDWVQLAPDRGGIYLAFQPAPPGSPGPTAGTIRLRPDIEVEDMDIAQARIEALGGRLVEIVHERTGDTHRRMADPEDNEFTILAPLPPDLAAQLYGKPD